MRVWRSEGAKEEAILICVCRLPKRATFAFTGNLVLVTGRHSFFGDVPTNCFDCKVGRGAAEQDGRDNLQHAVGPSR